MCIRDSFRTTIICSVAIVIALIATFCGMLALGFSINLLTPVSYTHLRAHETVLDLVCRLLLEKKKQQYSGTRGFRCTCCIRLP